MKRHLAAVLSGVAILLNAWGAFAQSQSASIAGTVRDTSGAVLPGVTIEIASPALIGAPRTVQTEDSGTYRAIELPPGLYTVTFTLSGFGVVKREGLILTPNFSATVNAELRIGRLEETVTVSGAAPTVDIRTVMQQSTLSREVLDVVPSGARTPMGLANLIPAAVMPPSTRDVGGSKSESSAGRLAIHGSNPGDQKLLIDGFRYNQLASNGVGRSLFVNNGAMEEVVISLGSGGSAEYSTGGVQVNYLPKSGGNEFSGYFFTNDTFGAMQSDNLTDHLTARGARSTTKLQYLYDVNGAVGFPIMQDKLWVYTAHRAWGDKFQIADAYPNARRGSIYFYEPDFAQPTAERSNWFQDHMGRVTWQASPKDRLNFLMEFQRSCTCQQNVSPTRTLEATQDTLFQPIWLMQASWVRPQGSRLLFEAGSSLMDATWVHRPQPGVNMNSTFQISEQSTGLVYGGLLLGDKVHAPQHNHRASVSFLPSGHNIKIGTFAMLGSYRIDQSPPPPFGRPEHALSYTFRNGLPIQLTQYATTIVENRVWPEFALFVQDQWTLKRLTLNYGLRLDTLVADVPASTQPANRFLPARSFEAVDCAPCWNDLSPRLAAAYDVFGNGKTAVKASVSRYVRTETSAIATLLNPVNASVNQVNRAWSDSNGNFVPDCVLTNPLANGECGQFANLGFGQTRITTRYAEDEVEGWHKRPYTWQAYFTVDQELRPGVAVAAGYFRTWYGNFFVTDNLAVTPADYDPYCITAPTDARLPGSGQRICGLYNLNPSKFGQVNNLITHSKHYGDETNVFNGVDLTVNARLSRGAFLQGGVAIGNSVAFGSDQTNSAERCFVVDSPQEMRFCDQPVPYTAQFKIFGGYPLPGGIQMSANYQLVPGLFYTATYNATTAQVAPSLGRPLSGSAATVPVELIQPWTEREDAIHQFDLRFLKKISIGRLKVEGTFDAYNIFNASDVTSQTVVYGTQWRRPLQVLDARMMKVGARVEF